MNNEAFWDIKTQFVPQGRHISVTVPNRLMVLRSQVFTELTMKNVVSWDIKTQFGPHRRHITSPLQSQAG
jgi:hypothetical protein